MTRERTPFERDILEQPAALERAAARPPASLHQLTSTPWERVVITGMGSSFHAGLPTWMELTARGLPAWAIDTGQLLDTPGLITRSTLLIVTSQSGESAEVVDLLKRRGHAGFTPQLLVGVVDDLNSTLASSSDVVLPLHSGSEATVSTKSYLNTLAVHRYIMGAFSGEDASAASGAIQDAASAVKVLLERPPGWDPAVLRNLAAHALDTARPRLATIGWSTQAATALYAALIIKEGAKLGAEGFVGGQFRHGPFELAGGGLTAVVFSRSGGPPEQGLHRLTTDLRRTGSTVAIVGGTAPPATIFLPTPGNSLLETTVTGAVVAQLLTVQFALANKVTPGAFAFGTKVTRLL